MAPLRLLVLLLVAPLCSAAAAAQQAVAQSISAQGRAEPVQTADLSSPTAQQQTAQQAVAQSISAQGRAEPVQTADLSSPTAQQQAARRTVEGLLAPMRSWEANFHQIVRDEKDNIVQEDWGELHIQRPHRFSWRVLRPHEQLILSDGEILWHHDPSLQQATRSLLTESLQRTPMLLLSGDVHQALRSFLVAAVACDTGNSCFSLLPQRTESEEIPRLWLEFRGPTLNNMRIHDQYDQQTEIYFSSVRMNTPLGQEHFVFRPSPETDILEY